MVVDAVLGRTPHGREAALLMDAIGRGRVAGFVAAHAVTTVHYLVTRAAGRGPAVMAVHDLLAVCRVAPLGDSEFQRALALGLRDFEDAVQVSACLAVGADYLVTHNPRDFRDAPVAVRSAGEVLAVLATA